VLVTSHRNAVRIARARGFDLAQSAPLADLARSENPRLVNFVTKQLPKWRQALRRTT
jgi:hypothetical protein